jgi:hypothetical protein
MISRRKGAEIMSFLVLIPVLGTGTAGCEARRIRAIERRADAAQAAIPLAASLRERAPLTWHQIVPWNARANDPVPPRIRVLVGADGVSVAVAGSGFFHERAVAIRDWRLATDDAGPQIAPLRAVLGAAIPTDAGVFDSVDVELYIHRDAPFSIWGRVMATMAWARMNPIPVVSTAAGDRALRVPIIGGGSGCPVPEIQIGPAGAQISIYPEARWLARAEPAPMPARAVDKVRKKGEVEPAWGVVIVPRRGVCPSVPRRDGRQGRQGRIDRTELVSLLRAIEAVRPDCATLGPPPPPDDGGLLSLLRTNRDLFIVPIEPSQSTTWQETIAVADAAAEVGYEDVQFLWPEGDARLDCADAVIPDDALGARFRAGRVD